MKLSDFLVRDSVIMELASSTKDDAIREIVRSVQSAGHLSDRDTEELTAAFLRREGLGATGIGRGVALPHAEFPFLDRVIGSLALAPRGVEFDAVDGKPVDVLITLFFPPCIGRRIRRDDPNEPYLAFNVVARHFEDDGFLSRLRLCRTQEAVLALIAEADRGAGAEVTSL